MLVAKGDHDGPRWKNGKGGINRRAGVVSSPESTIVCRRKKQPENRGGGQGEPVEIVRTLQETRKSCSALRGKGASGTCREKKKIPGSLKKVELRSEKARAHRDRKRTWTSLRRSTKKGPWQVEENEGRGPQRLDITEGSITFKGEIFRTKTRPGGEGEWEVSVQ